VPFVCGIKRSDWEQLIGIVKVINVVKIWKQYGNNPTAVIHEHSNSEEVDYAASVCAVRALGA
jgi:hypothetical protein